MKTKLLLCFALVILSCKTSFKNNETGMITTQQIAKGNLHGSGEEGISKQNLVITNAKDWQALVLQMNRVNTVSEQFAETDINFSDYDVIAVFSDVKGSGGYRIDLEVHNTSKHTVVKVKQKSPEGIATSVITQPYCIVKIPKTTLPVIFE